MVVTLMLVLNPKYYQNEIWPNTSSMLYDKLFQHDFDYCWRLGTSSSPFYDFIKMTYIARSCLL